MKGEHRPRVRMRQTEPAGMQAESPDAHRFSEGLVAGKVTVNIIANHWRMAGGSLHSDLMGPPSDEIDFDEGDPLRAILGNHSVGQFGVGTDSTLHDRAHTTLFSLRDEGILPGASRLRTAKKQGEVCFLNPTLLK